MMGSYLTLDEYRARSRITSSDGTDDALITSLILAASRWVDSYCVVDPGAFAAGGTAPAVRYVAGSGRATQWIPECISVTELATSDDGGVSYLVWGVGDYHLSDGAVYDRTPYRRIDAAATAPGWFPTGLRAVRITATWGWSATAPEAVREAVAILTRSMYLMRDAGDDADRDVITSSGLFIPASAVSRRVLTLLAPYRRLW